MKDILPRLIAAALAALLAAAPAGRAEPVKIRAAWVIAPASLVPILFEQPGIARHLGQSYSFEPLYFSASPAEITAVAAGEIDIATLGYSTLSLAIENAGLGDLRIIADEIQDGAKDYGTNQFMVRNDSEIKTVEDLKGKTLAVNGIGAGVDIAMRTMTSRHHLEYKRDFNILEVPFPSMKAVLAGRKVDLITAVLPFQYDPDLRSFAHTLYTQKEAFGTGELSFWTMRSQFLAQHHAAVVDLLEDYVRAIRWYIDPANHQAAVAIVARFTKQPAERLDSYLFTKKDDYRDPNGTPDLAVLQKNIDTQKQMGFLKTGLDVEKYADLSLIKAAVARIK